MPCSHGFARPRTDRLPHLDAAALVSEFLTTPTTVSFHGGLPHQEGRPFFARPNQLIVPQYAYRFSLISEEAGRKVPDHIGLTSREHEVFQWLAMGKSNPEIAGILGIATGTAKMHVQRILEKLEVDNRTEATLLAREWGLRVPRGPDGSP